MYLLIAVGWLMTLVITRTGQAGLPAAVYRGGRGGSLAGFNEMLQSSRMWRMQMDRCRHSLKTDQKEPEEKDRRM